MKSDHFWNILKSLCFEVENSKVHFIKSIEKRLTLNSNLILLNHNNVFVLCSQFYDVKYLKGKKYNRIVLICRNATLIKNSKIIFSGKVGTWDTCFAFASVQKLWTDDVSKGAVR